MQRLYIIMFRRENYYVSSDHQSKTYWTSISVRLDPNRGVGDTHTSFCEAWSDADETFVERSNDRSQGRLVIFPPGGSATEYAKQINSRPGVTPAPLYAKQSEESRDRVMLQLLFMSNKQVSALCERKPGDVFSQQKRVAPYKASGSTSWQTFRPLTEEGCMSEQKVDLLALHGPALQSQPPHCILLICVRVYVCACVGDSCLRVCVCLCSVQLWLPCLCLCIRLIESVSACVCASLCSFVCCIVWCCACAICVFFTSRNPVLMSVFTCRQCSAVQ